MAGERSPSEMMSVSVIMSSDMMFDLYCEICSEDGKHLEAEGFCVDCKDYLCKDCYKGHRSSRACKSHTLQDKTQMPRQMPPSVKPKLNTEKCASHPDRLIEYYCRDDNTLGCSVCITMIHRTCQCVDHIPDMAAQLIDSHEYKTLKSTLSSLKTKTQNVIKSTKENVVKADKWYIDAERTLQKLRNKMNAAFNKLEKELRTKAKTIKSTDANKMKAIADKGTALFNEVEEISTDLQSLQNKNQLCQLFIQMIKLEEKVETLQKRVVDADADNIVTSYTLEPSSKMQEIMDDPASICKLSVKSSVRQSSSRTTKDASQKTLGHSSTEQPKATVDALPVAKDPQRVNADLVTEINVRTESDKKYPQCWINGSALIQVNKLILLDHVNYKVKLLNLQSKKVTSEIKTSSQPWGISNITGDQVAVTLRHSKKIAFVTVTDILRLDREMQVDGRCADILYSNGKLIVSFHEPKKIEIMDLDGTVERNIDGSYLLGWPLNMGLGLDNEMYLTDDKNKCVKRITMDGKVKAVYTDWKLEHPRGITVDQQGRVLVCGGGSGNIHLLTSDLTKVKVIIDGLHEPKCLSYCHTLGRLYVGASSDNLKVYQLS